MVADATVAAAPASPVAGRTTMAPDWEAEATGDKAHDAEDRRGAIVAEFLPVSPAGDCRMRVSDKSEKGRGMNSFRLAIRLAALACLAAIGTARRRVATNSANCAAGGGGGCLAPDPLAVVEDIEARVLAAGGNDYGALVVSLAWSTPDDLDLRVQVPGPGEINYNTPDLAGGSLDVEMCVGGYAHLDHGHCAERPTENVVFPRAAAGGRYRVLVQNTRYWHRTRTNVEEKALVRDKRQPNRAEQALRLTFDRAIPFHVLVKAEGAVPRFFEGLCIPERSMGAGSIVPVFELDDFPAEGAQGTRLERVFEAPPDPTCADFERSMGADSIVPVFEFDYFPAAGAQGARLESVFEAPPDPACADFERRYAEAAASETSAAERPPRRSPGRRGSRARRRRRTGRPPVDAPKGTNPKQAALALVRGSARSGLLAKSAKVLRQLISDLGTSCRGCMEKKDFADRLLQVAAAAAEL